MRDEKNLRTDLAGQLTRFARNGAFNAVQLQRSRANVRGLGFFKSVDVKTEPGSADDRVVIKTDVQEQSTGQLSFGLGFSSGDGVAGEVSITERNLLGRGQYLRLSGQLSATSRIYDIRFTEPYFLDRNLVAGFDLFRLEYDRTSTSGYQTRTTGFRPRLSFPLGQYARLSTRYEISQDEILKVPTTASPLIQAEIGSELTSSVGYTLTYDRRNDPLEPTRGYLLTLDQDVAGLGGDARYVRTEASGKVFRSLFRDDVIGSVEVAGGGIIGFGGYKPRANDRFSLGGDSFRGFRSSGLGPRDGSDFLGGKYYGMVRTEVSFPIGLPDEYGVYGGVFADAGTLFSLDNVNGTTTVDDGLKMRASLGASLFWTSPFGPIRLNFATPVVKQDGDEAEYFRFTIGGRF